MNYIVYKIIDGRTNEIKYVGQTTKSIQKRLLGHLSSRYNNKSKLDIWINMMFDNGFEEYIKIFKIDSAINKKELNKKEYLAIMEISKRHCLLNRNIPGQPSNSGRKCLPDSEKKVSLVIYPRQKDIDLIGGEVIAKEKALNAISGS